MARHPRGRRSGRTPAEPARGPVLGIAAAVGLVLSFTGALLVDLRARVYALAAPGVFWLPALAGLVVAVAITS